VGDDMFPVPFCERFDHFQEHAPVYSWGVTVEALRLAFSGQSR
jgi:hypothetical protein